MDAVVAWFQRFVDPSDYAFWFLLLGLAFVLLERCWAWRRQPLMRPQLVQDIGWAVANGLLVGVGIALFLAHVWQPTPPPVLLETWPWWSQFVVVLVVKDLLEYWVHRLLHAVPALWTIHRLHHSIRDMDWLGNMRFHPLEVVIYKMALWLPLAVVVIDWRVALVLAVVQTAIGHLNHANIRWDWGPLRYVLNSPRFHVWHHDRSDARGCNYGIVFSCWDWLFGTARWPAEVEQPERLGFADDDRYPRSWWRRLLSV